jgi:hypothetical protein
VQEKTPVVTIDDIAKNGFYVSPGGTMIRLMEVCYIRMRRCALAGGTRIRLHDAVIFPVREG